MQKSLFPMKSHRVSCAYNQGKAHKKCSTGTPHDYPTDLVGKDTGRDWFYAPCDMVVVRKYTKASHAIWLRSLNKVNLPYGEGYLYIMSEHQDNKEMPGVGHVYRQGAKCFREGRNGNATGNHLHVSCGFSKEKKDVKSGWCRNSKGAWVLRIAGVTPIKIHQAFYSTFVLDAMPKKPKASDYVAGKSYVTKANLYLRKGPSKNAHKVKKDGEAILIKEGTRVIPTAVIGKNGEIWLKKGKSGYICAYDGKQVLVK